VMSTVITVGLIVLPSIFAWYNILACWNVFENTGNLSVAVANDDAGFTSDLIPIEVNVGDKVVSELRGNDQINWVITNSDDAVEDTKSGKYYAALVIPEDFSYQMLTFYDGDAESARIAYYVNEKKNAISPNIIGTGADTVSYEVNATFAQALSEIGAGLGKSLSGFVGDSDAEGEIALLADRMRSMADRIDSSAEVLTLYSSLTADAGDLLASSAAAIESARGKAVDAPSASSVDGQTLRDLADGLVTSVDALSSELGRNSAVLDDLNGKLDAVAAEYPSGAQAAASQLRSLAGQLDAQAAELDQRRAVLEQIREDLDGHETEGDGGSGGADTPLLDRSIAELSHAASSLRQSSSDLYATADELETGTGDAQELLGSVRSGIAEAKTDLEGAAGNVENGLKPSVENLRTDLYTLSDDFDKAVEDIGAAKEGVPSAAGQVKGALSNVSGTVDGTQAKLHAAAGQMRALADAIDEALASGDSETLKALLAGNVDDLATALSMPVSIERHALFPVENFGSAMAPLYNALALFIGSLLIMVALKPQVSERGRKQLVDPKPRHLYFGRFGVVALLSLMQTTVLGLGNMLFLKVQVADPALFMLCFWVSGLVFAFIIYTLVVAFGNLGKALAVLLLIVQVTGCGGSYPLPILPGFVQSVSPYLPATQVVNAMRAAMFGVYQNDFWVAMGMLLLFVLPCLLLGLVLRKPLERFMQLYISKVEESKLM